MDSKVALREPNSSAAPPAGLTPTVALLRSRPTWSLFLTGSGGQCGLQCNQNPETYPWSLKGAEHPVPGLHAPLDYEHLNDHESGGHESGGHECCDQVARSVLPCGCYLCVLVLAVLSRWRMNAGPNSYRRSHLLALPSPCSGVRVNVEALCWPSVVQYRVAIGEPPPRLISGIMTDSVPSVPSALRSSSKSHHRFHCFDR